MLEKLIKYEIRAAGGTFLIFWAAAVLLAMISGISAHGENLPGILVYLFATIFFMVAFIMIIFLTIVMMINRFYKKMLTTEGYLTHMFPAKPWQHIISNLITSLIWIAASLVVFFGASLLMYLISGSSIGEFMDVLSEAAGGFSGISAGNIVLYIMYFLADVIMAILLVYAAILIGGCANKHKGLFAFLTFIVLVAVVSILTHLLGLGEIVSIVDAEGAQIGYFTAATWKGVGFQVILLVIFFFVSRDLLAKKVNLT